ncbi:hypothetical protein NM688_g4633 [Phlebia brevispora]|uniref:Uncharacterized protein n=1 Tax=Phlebia brevispora TaxID=194682 RepID=A0ACC1T2D5_9APHY|nr:hypothetical protein NM688_g4633 [Phlebia brevispora]
MQFSRLFSFLTAAAAFGAVAAAPAELRELRISNLTSTDDKRAADYSGRFTYFYEDGSPGACGGVNGNNEYIVALNSAQYDGGAHCWELITISYGSQTTTAAIVDECPGCPEYGLDLTPALFEFLAGSLDAGVIYGTWEYQ